MTTPLANIGLIGLGTMGANLALNMAEKGFVVAVFNRTPAKTRALVAEGGEPASRLVACETLESFVAAIRPPRAVVLMVTAGSAVDEQIAALRPLLDDGDVIIDAGNADFRDTERRATEAAAHGWAHLGVGVSGGEDGARHGPSVMAGGALAAWERVEPIFRAIAARHEGDPCAARMGDGGAGHFVKTVHNGIEYADMEMIAETWGILRDGLAMTPAAAAAVFARWNQGALRSYLIEISAEVAAAIDADTGRPMLDIILDRAGQKGTGGWTVIEAQHLGSPVGAIEAAVSARNLSSRVEARRRGAEIYGAPMPGTIELSPDVLEKALIAGKIIAYAQGFGLLASASVDRHWALPMATIARIWRAGCIIRSDMLSDMARALEGDPQGDLMQAPAFVERLRATIDSLRRVVAAAALAGLPVPALAAALAYFDTMRQPRTTADLLQAQRDFFGAHGFERVDRPGIHHGRWTR